MCLYLLMFFFLYSTNIGLFSHLDIPGFATTICEINETVDWHLFQILNGWKWMISFLHNPERLFAIATVVYDFRLLTVTLSSHDVFESLFEILCKHVENA